VEIAEVLGEALGPAKEDEGAGDVAVEDAVVEEVVVVEDLAEERKEIRNGYRSPSWVVSLRT